MRISCPNCLEPKDVEKVPGIRRCLRCTDKFVIIYDHDHKIWTSIKFDYYLKEILSD